VKLGSRLAALAAMVPAGSKVADIGTDHAYLPIHLVFQNIVTAAVAGDVHKGPFQSALDTVSRLGLAGKIAVRLGDGLSVVNPGEVDTVVIAGMGGSTIIKILTNRPEVTSSLNRLILQPMQAANTLRRWLGDNKWRLVDETLVEEEEKLYEIIVAEQGTDGPIEPIMYEIGPLLWQRKHPLLRSHIENLINHYRRVITEMAKGLGVNESAKYREYEARLEQLEERYTWLLNAVK
jgi:tRNA (adenine22-N1)-methyltransferase